MMARRYPLKPRGRNAHSVSADTSQLKQVLKAIETERDNLSRAESLLGCLAIAMEYGEMSHKGPYYPDLVQLAAKMLKKSINAMDPIHLPNPVRGKIREEFFANDGAPQVVAMLAVPLLPRPTFARPPSCSLRIHRRNYSRTAARNASSTDSASANISGWIVR
jgi:hypothetical protein